MKGKARQEKGGNKMKKAIITILVAVVLMNAEQAFAHWKAPVGLVLQDPAPCPFDNKNF